MIKVYSLICVFRTDTQRPAVYNAICCLTLLGKDIKVKDIQAHMQHLTIVHNNMAVSVIQEKVIYNPTGIAMP